MCVNFGRVTDVILRHWSNFLFERAPCSYRCTYARIRIFQRFRISGQISWSLNELHDNVSDTREIASLDLRSIATNAREIVNLWRIVVIIIGVISTHPTYRYKSLEAAVYFGKRIDPLGERSMIFCLAYSRREPGIFDGNVQVDSNEARRLSILLILLPIDLR